MKRKEWLTVPLLLLFSAGAVSAQDFFDMTDREPERRERGNTANALNLSGNFSHRYQYAVREQLDHLPFRREDAGPGSVRYDLRLTARYRAANNVVFQLSGLGSHDVILEDTSRLDLDQTYVEWGATPSFNLKAGRQIIALGESSFFQITDRINPVDERAFGLAELRETRWPVTATRLSYYPSRWGVDLVAVHEFRRNIHDEPLGDFDPYIEFRDSFADFDDSRPNVDLANPDLAIRVFRSQSWGDVALFLSRMHSRHAMPISVSGNTLNLDYPEVTRVGASANLVFNNVLLKSEYAYSDGELYMHEQGSATGAHDLSVPGQSHQLMAGVRYSGISNLVVDMELLASLIDSTEGSLDEDRRQLEGAVSLEYQMLNDDLLASMVYAAWANNFGSMVRLRLDYIFRDDIELFTGAVAYNADAGDAMLAPYRNNDRVFAGFTYSF